MKPRAEAHRVSNAWVVFRPSQQIRGVWIAHALEFDVVTQGTSLAHAIQMVQEAIAMVVADDLKHGRDPYSRRAPDKYWDELRELRDSEAER